MGVEGKLPRWLSVEFSAVAQFESIPREIPRPAGEDAGLRDDAESKGVKRRCPIVHFLALVPQFLFVDRAIAVEKVSR